MCISKSCFKLISVFRSKNNTHFLSQRSSTTAGPEPQLRVSQRCPSVYEVELHFISSRKGLTSLLIPSNWRTKSYFLDHWPGISVRFTWTSSFLKKVSVMKYVICSDLLAVSFLFDNFIQVYGALRHAHLPTLPFQLPSVLYPYIVLSVTLTPTRPSRPAPPTEAPSHCLEGSNRCLENRNWGVLVQSWRDEETVVGFFTRCLHSNCWRWVSSEDIPRRVSVYSVTKRVSCSLEQSGLLVPVANQGQGPQLSQHWQFFTNSS